MSHPRLDACPPDAQWEAGSACLPAHRAEPPAPASTLPVIVVAELASADLVSLCRTVVSHVGHDTRVVLLVDDACDHRLSWRLDRVRLELARRGCAVPVCECPADSHALAAALATSGPVLLVPVPRAPRDLAEASKDLRVADAPAGPSMSRATEAELRRSAYAALQMSSDGFRF